MCWNEEWCTSWLQSGSGEWNGTAAGSRVSGSGVTAWCRNEGVGVVCQLGLECVGVGVVNGSGFLKFRKSKAILPSDKSYVS